MQQQQTISSSDCDVRQKVYFMQLVTTSLVVGPRRSSKALPKAKLAPKKGHRHCLVVCCQSDPLQLSESWWNHCIWEVCSTNQWEASKTAMPAIDIGQQKGPSAPPWQYVTQCHTTNASKVEQSGLQSFASSTTFTWPLANWLPLLQSSWQLFAGKILPQPVGGRKYFEFIESRSMDFYTTWINKRTSHRQKCVDCNGSCLINKDVFVSTYNDLKFSLKLHLLFTNLILGSLFCFVNSSIYI